ncbi:MAG: hypothetical protein ACKN9T_05285 [Candidatus Methylumidiphilus sp.]
MFSRLKPLALLSIFAFSPHCYSEEASKPADAHWAFNLSLYTWLAGLNGNFSVGPLSQSVDVNFIDIVNKSRRPPLGVNGRIEANYDRFGVFLNGGYLSIRMSPAMQNFSRGLDTDLGQMDYGLSYRLFGPAAAEAPNWQGKKQPNRLDVYVGGRTLLLENGIEIRLPLRVVAPSASHSFTSPIIGGRFIVDFTPDIFMQADANGGGFGVDNVSFTGGITGLVGYKLSAFDIPLSIQVGYKAIRYDVNGGAMRTRATLNGPFFGLTSYW